MSLLQELDQIDRMKDTGEITQKQHDILSAKAEKKYQKNDKSLKIAVVALVFALMAIGINSSGVSNYYNNTTIFNSSNGTANHANLTNLTWSTANHTIDADIQMNGYSLRTDYGINATIIRPGTDNISFTVDNSAYNTMIMDGYGFDFYRNATFQSNAIFENGINMTGTDITNCGNCAINITSQNTFTGKTINTIYRNNLTKPIFVSAQVIVNQNSGVQGWTGVNATPDKLVAAAYISTATAYQQVFFIVLPDYYYRVNVSAGTPTLYTWVEWS